MNTFVASRLNGSHTIPHHTELKFLPFRERKNVHNFRILCIDSLMFEIYPPNGYGSPLPFQFELHTKCTYEWHRTRCIFWRAAVKRPLSTSILVSMEKCVFHYHFHVLCLQSFYKHLQNKFPAHNIFSEEMAEKLCVYLFVCGENRGTSPPNQMKWVKNMKTRKMDWSL